MSEEKSKTLKELIDKWIRESETAIKENKDNKELDEPGIFCSHHALVISVLTKLQKEHNDLIRSRIEELEEKIKPTQLVTTQERLKGAISELKRILGGEK
jgi:hypothetical protein